MGEKNILKIKKSKKNYYKNKIYYEKEEMRTIETNIEYILFVFFRSYSYQLLEHSFFLLPLFLLFFQHFYFFFFFWSSYRNMCIKQKLQVCICDILLQKKDDILSNESNSSSNGYDREN